MGALRGQGYRRVEDNHEPWRARENDIPMETLYQPPRRSAKLPAYTSSTQEYSVLDTGKAGSKSFWQPFYLQQTTLLGFFCLWVVIIVALQLLYSYSQRHHGLGTSEPSKHYLWTYGPTAGFVILGVLWRGIDSQAKQLMPWAEMIKGATPVDKSVLLDYSSPVQASSLLTACKNRHYIVVSSILGFAFVKLMVVASSGLLVLQDELFSNTPISFTAQAKFDGADFQHGAAVDSRPVLAVYGIRSFNLSFPAGTIANYAFQSFNATSTVPPRSVLKGVVDAFSADLDCETGILTYTDGRDLGQEITPLSQYYNVTVSSKSCHIVDAHLDAPDWVGNMTGQGYYGRIQSVNCTNLPADAVDSNRILIALAYSTRENDTNTMHNSSNVICKPQYNISQATVEVNTTSSAALGGIRLTLNPGKEHKLPNVSPWDIARGVFNALSSAQLVGQALGNQANISLDAFFSLLVESKPDLPISAFLDPGLVESTSRDLFGAISSQLARQYLMVPAADTFTGAYDHFEGRVFVRSLSLRLMQSSLATLAILTAIVLLLAPRNVVSRCPDSIGAIAAILVESPSFIKTLRGTGHSSLDMIRSLISGKSYRTVANRTENTDSFRIETDSQVINEEQSGSSLIPSPSDAPIKWWRPLALKPFMITLALAAPLALIAALEIVYRQSVRHSGLADVVSDGYIRFTWIYIPTLVFVSVATLFNMLQFETQVLQPYHALRVGKTSARKSILNNPLNKTTVVVLWDSIRNCQFATLATTISVLLCPLLTVVASGLYTVENDSFSREINVQQLTWFNTSLSEVATEDLKQGMVASLIVEGNLSYPSWTYEEVAIPRITIKPQHGLFNDLGQLKNSTSLNVRLPAVRGTLNCTILPGNRLVNATVSHSYMLVNISTPDGCGNTGWIDQPLTTLQGSVLVPQTGYFGQLMDVSNPPCPTIISFFGHVTKGKTKPDNLTILACAPFVERLEVNASFTLPDFGIDPSHPPVADEATAVFFSKLSESFLENEFQALNISSDAFDNFFNAVVFGKSGVPPDELLRPDNLLNSMEHLYRILMAQVLHADARIPADTTTATLSGTYTDPFRKRLQQNTLSTRLLQALLAALFLCAAVAYGFMGSRKVVPKNPHSIAAVGSLLADSRLLSREFIPQGAEWWSDKEMIRNGLFAGLSLRMGWFDDGFGETGRGFGIDIEDT